MEVFLENIIIYTLVAVIIIGIFYLYLKTHKYESKQTLEKIKRAKEYGFHEPVSLHPVINEDICIGSGACVVACPENDIIGLVNGKGKLINASHCVGHGACFHACPVEAITLVMGTEKRGVELPHVSPEYETNVRGIYIAGELGGMGLIKNAIEQGKKAVDSMVQSIEKKHSSKYDIIIIGAGPAGIAATLRAAEHNLNFLTIEQDSIGGTVFSFPRAKVVMTSPVEIPLFGKVKLYETTKSELIDLWSEILAKNKISINENEKVSEIIKYDNSFKVITNQEEYTTQKVLLAIGRRGSPRKLGVPGENSEKVYYKLLEPELIHNKKILVVGGGDSAIESALLLAEEGNEVSLSYRSNSFKRLKPKNFKRIEDAIKLKLVNVLYNSTVKEITHDKVILNFQNGTIAEIENDLVYVFIGGELPNKFLEKIGIKITKKFGEAVLKH